MPRLRVGVFADSARQPRWMVEALARAAATPRAEIALVAVGSPSPFRERAGVGAAASSPLWRAYAGLDRRLFGSREGLNAPTDVTTLVGAERRLSLDGEGWLARVADARLDIAFVLGEAGDAPLEGLARHGTWRFCFGEAQCGHAEAAALQEVRDGNEVLASGIRIHRPGRRDRIACASYGRVYPFSVARSHDAAVAKAADFLTRALRDLRARGSRWLDEGTEPAREPALHAFPSASGAVRDIALLTSRVAQRAAEKALTVDTWSIAYRFSPEEDWSGTLAGFHRLDPPKGWYWADPFPIQVAGRNYIFFEELPYGADRAHISVVEVDREGRASKPQRALERDYHLSYPFLVEEDGELYMIPETGQNRTVEVYRCVEFPTKWKLERTLLSGVFCCDATLHRAADGRGAPRWWMFANSASFGDGINDELHLFGSDSLLGDWKPHRRNPVKSDVRSARPAGRLFEHGGGLYRPGQICTPLYGAGIALHRVERLTDDEFVEREEKRIQPLPPAIARFGGVDSVLGIHTINRAGDLSVTDAFTRQARF